MSVLLKFQSSGAIPGDGRPVRMQGDSLTVGRGETNDVVLPDPDRTISKSHFVIEDHNGNVLIVDLSTNGTFLNYSKIPLGRTPTPLNDGDVLSAGPYEMVVEIGSDTADPGMADPLADASVSFGSAEAAPDPAHLLDAPAPEGDFLDDLLGSDTPQGPAGMNIPDPIDELLPTDEEIEDPILPGPAPEEVGDSDLLHGSSIEESLDRGRAPAGGGNLIPDDWDADPFAEDLSPSPPAPPSTPDTPAPPAPAAPAPPPAASPPAASPPAAPPPAASPPAATAPSLSEQTVARGGQPGEDTAPAPRSPSPSAPPPPATEPPPPHAAAAPGGADAARAYLTALDIEGLEIADADLADTMARMGRVTRKMVEGLREVLMTRTSIKGEFRIDQTMISAQGNNPLKFSISPDQAVEALVKPRTRGYLDAEAATAEALDDIKAHEVAMVTGMEAALKGVLARLDPGVLASKIEGSGAIGSLFKGKKARYWEVYEKMYAEISEQAEDDFQELFAREFARAYSEQLKKLG